MDLFKLFFDVALVSTVSTFFSYLVTAWLLSRVTSLRLSLERGVLGLFIVWVIVGAGGTYLLLHDFNLYKAVFLPDFLLLSCALPIVVTLAVVPFLGLRRPAAAQSAGTPPKRPRVGLLEIVVVALVAPLFFTMFATMNAERDRAAVAMREEARVKALTPEQKAADYDKLRTLSAENLKHGRELMPAGDACTAELERRLAASDSPTAGNADFKAGFWLQRDTSQRQPDGTWKLRTTVVPRTPSMKFFWESAPVSPVYDCVAGSPDNGANWAVVSMEKMP